MIGRVKQALRGSRGWTVESQLVVQHERDQSPLPEESAPGSNEAKIIAYSPVPTDSGDYYTNLVKAAVQGNGRLGADEISIAWLRMILSGLEGRPIDVEDLWEGVELRGWNPSHEGIPDYYQTFPNESESN